jgi:hypothetical protein
MKHWDWPSLYLPPNHPSHLNTVQDRTFCPAKRGHFPQHPRHPGLQRKLHFLTSHGQIRLTDQVGLDNRRAILDFLAQWINYFKWISEIYSIVHLVVEFSNHVFPSSVCLGASHSSINPSMHPFIHSFPPQIVVAPSPGRLPSWYRSQIAGLSVHKGWILPEKHGKRSRKGDERRGR